MCMYLAMMGIGFQHKTNICLVYRANFSMTFKEMRAPEGHYKYVIPTVLGCVVISYFMFTFFKERCKCT